MAKWVKLIALIKNISANYYDPRLTIINYLEIIMNVLCLSNTPGTINTIGGEYTFLGSNSIANKYIHILGKAKAGQRHYALHS